MVLFLVTAQDPMTIPTKRRPQGSQLQISSTGCYGTDNSGNAILHMVLANEIIAICCMLPVSNSYSVTACRQAVAAGLVPAYLSYSGTPLNLCGLQNPQVIEQLLFLCK